MRWTTYAFAMLAFSVVGGLLTYALLRLQGHLPLNPQHFTGTADDSGPVVQHGDVVHDQHQLAELLAGDHRQLLLQHGCAGDAQLDVGGDGHRRRHRAGARLRPAFGQRPRQLLGRYDPRHALRAAADLSGVRLCSWSGRACRRTSRPTRRRRRWRARSRPSRRGRWPRRKPSRCSAPTAAASSTPTRRIPTRTRLRSPTSCRCSPSS